MSAYKPPEESETKKCGCGKPAVGVISTLFGHRYVCRGCARKAEKEGWFIDYDNWRL